MDKFEIQIAQENENIVFEVIDYAHDEENKCKFEVFRDRKFVASFEPDSRGFLHVCKNPGNIDENILDSLAEKIESYHF